MRLSHFHLHGLDRGMVLKYARGDPLRQGLDELHGRSLDDAARHAVYLAVVHGPGQVVRKPSRPQVEAQLDADDERLAQIVLGWQGPVMAVEDHLGEEYAVLAHRVFSPPSIRSSMTERIVGCGVSQRMRLVREVGYSKTAGYPTTTWRSETEKMPSIRRVARAGLPTSHGSFELFVYEALDGKEHVALTTGLGSESPKEDGPVLIRLHSECLTGDVFGSRRCDCGGQLEESMRLLREQGRGVLLYLRQEGRGVGLSNKISAYALQDEGLDTVQANLALGLPEDARDYSVAAEMLLDLGVYRAVVLTNNPAKVEGLRSHGVEVVERLPVQVEPNPLNIRYLRTKEEKLGHLFPSLLVPGERPAGDSANGAS